MKNNKDNSLSEASVSRFEAFCDDTMDEWFKAKHRKPSPAELELVNGLDVSKCPHCGHEGFKRSGYYGNRTRRYRCLGCGRTFSPLTGTLFDSHKIPLSEWIEYLIHLFEFHSVSSSSRDNRNVKNTGKYWITKVFAVLSDCRLCSQEGSTWMRHISPSCQRMRRERTASSTEGFRGTKYASHRQRTACMSS